ncbi:hypothetical protein ACQP3J_29230, partial [Escherichia coli]
LSHYVLRFSVLIYSLLVSVDCLVRVSIAMIKYCDQGNVQKGGLTWGLWLQKVKRPWASSQINMALSRHSGWSWKLRAEGSHLEPQTGRGERKWGLVHGF